MANARLPMRKIREVLRLRFECKLSLNRIATALGASSSTIHEYLVRAAGAGLSWPLPQNFDDHEIEQLLFGSGRPEATRSQPTPDWKYIHRELRRKGVTLALLWEEFKTEHPTGIHYSQFCDLYRRFAKSVDVTMRQVHRAGEKVFVDYAGQTVPVVDPSTGEVRHAQIFVAVLGASSYTFAEATWSQSSYDWQGSHVRAFEFFGGVPEVVVPDNLKSGVTRPCRYEPEINTAYLSLATHYGTVILPARVRKPRDKAKAENGVLFVERWILAVLRNRQFFSLNDLNEAIGNLVELINVKPFKKLEGCRATLFEQVDKPVLRPLPPYRYEVADWKKARVNLDYHVELERHYYSVPYHLVHQEVEIRYNTGTVEILWRGKRVASHARSFRRGLHSTVAEHMPKSHQQFAGLTPGRLIANAERIGPQTALLATEILRSRQHPEQGFRSCLGILRLEKKFGPDRLEAACGRALAIGALSYRSVDSILKNGIEHQLVPRPQPPLGPILHTNIRGADFFNMEEDNAEPPHA